MTNTPTGARLSPAMRRMLRSLRKQVAAGRGHDLSCEGFTTATRHALRDRGFIRYADIRSTYYETRGSFGRGNYRRHAITTCRVVWAEGA